MYAQVPVSEESFHTFPYKVRYITTTPPTHPPPHQTNPERSNNRNVEEEEEEEGERNAPPSPPLPTQKPPSHYITSASFFHSSLPPSLPPPPPTPPQSSATRQTSPKGLTDGRWTESTHLPYTKYQRREGTEFEKPRTLNTQPSLPFFPFEEEMSTQDTSSFRFL